MLDTMTYDRIDGRGLPMPEKYQRADASLRLGPNGNIGISHHRGLSRGIYWDAPAIDRGMISRGYNADWQKRMGEGMVH